MHSSFVKQLEHFSSEQLVDIFDSLFSEATEGIMIEDPVRNILAINQAMLHFMGKTENDLVGSNSQALAHLIEQKNYDIIGRALKEEGSWCGELEINVTGIKSKLVWVSIDVVTFKNKRQCNVIMVTDISEIKRSQQQLEYIATHDTLTDLPNRVLLYDRLAVSVSRVHRSDALGAVIFIDIDNFKDINDNFGHAYGDQLLKICANILTESLRAKDTVGRLSGDEFLIIVDDFYAVEDIEAVVKKILGLFDKLIEVHDIEFNLSVSMGISVYPDNSTEVEELINQADISMHHVKQSGRNNYAFYSSELSDQSHQVFKVGQGIKQALRNDSFYMVYQPQIALETGLLVGVEALLRCRDPHLAETGTEELIEIAEKSSMIIEIGKRTLALVCKQIAEWKEQGTPACVVAVNLSRRQLSDRNLVGMIVETLNSYSVNVSQIEFEITENSLVHSHVFAQENMKKLRELGFTFSIDDFGTGYSSLSNLKNFTLDKLKIDKSFINDILDNRNDQIIVEATINMAKNLGLIVLAEGVETQEQATLLHQYGCDQMQGYLYSKPISSKAFELLSIHGDQEYRGVNAGL